MCEQYDHLDNTWKDFETEFAKIMEIRLRPLFNKQEADQEVEHFFDDLSSRLDHLVELPSSEFLDNSAQAKEQLKSAKKKIDLYRIAMREFNKYRSTWSTQAEGFHFTEDSPCKCGGLYDNNSAHLLSHQLIQKGWMDEFPTLCMCCPAGRPIRQKELRDQVFNSERKMPEKYEIATNVFLYCEKKIDGVMQEHVYFGTKDVCVEGDGRSADDFSKSCYIKYYKGFFKKRPKMHSKIIILLFLSSITTVYCVKPLKGPQSFNFEGCSYVVKNVVPDKEDCNQLSAYLNV
uniref:Uncharacterized protein n=1 Tax=Ditylenchus dipsaci TaxID=166011 RepID=A0A915CPI4_9BILA